MIQGFCVVTLASHVALPFLVILVTVGFHLLLSGSQPKGYINILLESKLTVRPPEPIPELLERKNGKKFGDRRKPKAQISAKATPITGEQVKVARKAKGWSQVKLAGMIGVSQQLISHIESGRREPTPEVEADLRSVLKL